MKNNIQDHDVIRMLERWKGRESAYPLELQNKRRAAVLALGVSLLGAGPAWAIGEITGQVVHAAKLPITLGTKIVLGIASTAFVGLSTYLGITAYENRDAIREFFQTSTPTITLVSPSEVIVFPPLATPTYIPTGTPTPTGTLTPTGTPTPTIIPTNTPAPRTLPTTPASGGPTYPQATQTSPGHHYGQTKTPKPK